MSKIVKLQEASKLISNYQRKDKSLVLIGGCFDILHPGHIHFLQKAKKMGDVLAVVLESDKKVKKLKGSNRPFHRQNKRAEMLSSLCFVDLVILLPFLRQDKDYNDLISDLKPDIVAVTENDPLLEKKRRQVKSASGILKIIPHIKTASTSKLAKLLGID